VISAPTRDRLGLAAGSTLLLGSAGSSVELPWIVGDIADDVVWAPANSAGVNLRRDLRAGAGSVVMLRAGGA
jgi:NADH-quinone oxidoreductase subunit G